MDQVQHKFVTSQGLKLHVAELGTGSNVVLFLHGFPEIWYTWRHQMAAVAKAGFRALAPDYRGYGLSDLPPEPEKASFKDIIADLLAVLDALAIDKGWLIEFYQLNIIKEGDSIKRQKIVLKSKSAMWLRWHIIKPTPYSESSSRVCCGFLIAKDFGARPAYLFSVLHKERVRGVVTMGVPLLPPSPPKYHEYLPEGFYISRWQEPGRAEADFDRLDAKTVVRNVYILFSRSDIPIASENQEIMDLVDNSTPLPPWFTEDDLAEYGALYEKSGFRTALQVPYRSFWEDHEIPDPVVKAPALLIMGEKDYVLKFPGIEDYIRMGKAYEFAPNLEVVFMPEGTHFVHEQSPEEVNKLILSFISKHV